MIGSRIQRFTDSAAITNCQYLRNVILSPGSDAASCTVKTGGSEGTAILTLTAVANGATVSASLSDAPCPDGYVALTGTGPSVSVVYR